MRAESSDLSAHRTRSNVRSSNAVDARDQRPTAPLQQEGSRPSAADRSTSQAPPKPEALTPHPDMVAEIDDAMRDIVEDKD